MMQAVNQGGLFQLKQTVNGATDYYDDDNSKAHEKPWHIFALPRRHSTIPYCGARSAGDRNQPLMREPVSASRAFFSTASR